MHDLSTDIHILPLQELISFVDTGTVPELELRKRHKKRRKPDVSARRERLEDKYWGTMIFFNFFELCSNT